MSALAGAAERRILDIVGRRVRAGRASITLPDGTHRMFEGRHAGPAAHVTLHRWRPLRLVTTTGAIGLADAYVRGDYDVDDLEAFLELCALHLEPAYRAPVPGLAPPVRTVRLAGARRSRHGPRGPLTDIVQHYDLGNDFYAEWLDETMTYSSAVFAEPDDMPLADAQRREVSSASPPAPACSTAITCSRSARAGAASPSTSPTSSAAGSTTVTISKEQHEYVEKLVVEHGLVDRVDARLQDFSHGRAAPTTASSRWR